MGPDVSPVGLMIRIRIYVRENQEKWYLSLRRFRHVEDGFSVETFYGCPGIGTEFCVAMSN